MSIFSKPDPTRPYAEVEQVGRHRWRIRVVYDQFFTTEARYRRSRRSAERKAAKELARYNRKYGDLDAGFTLQ